MVSEEAPARPLPVEQAPSLADNLSSRSDGGAAAVAAAWSVPGPSTARRRQLRCCIACLSACLLLTMRLRTGERCCCWCCCL